MTKYEPRHRCKGHKWIEIASWYEVFEGFHRLYSCLNCDNMDDRLDPIPEDYKYKEATWN